MSQNLLSLRPFLARLLQIGCFVFLACQHLAAVGRSAERPNILIAIADDWSYGHAGAYGCKWVETPNFDRVAASGLLFKHAFTPNAKCAPSRASILTGRYSWQLEEAGNHMAIFPPKFGGFVERLAADGYRAGFTGKGWGPGVANDSTGKPRLITGKNYNQRKTTPPATGISNNDYAGNFADFLADSNNDQPWVFWYGATEPHRGYEFKSGVRAGKSLNDIDRVPAYWPDDETVRHDMLDYAVEVEHYDRHLGRILDQLANAGQLSNTLIIATSDHGMPFPRVKGQAYADSNHIPLAIQWAAGINAPGREIDDFVNFTDLAPTILKAAQVEQPAPIMQPLSGQSLMGIFESSNEGQVDASRDHVLVGKERHDVGRPADAGYPIRGIRQGDLLYLKNFATDRWPAGNPETGYLNCDGGPTKSLVLNLRRSGASAEWWKLCFGKRPSEEFYDVGNDPDCVKNLINDPNFADTIRSLRQRMQAELTDQGDPRMLGRGDIFDMYPYATSDTKNFYERFMAGEKLKAGWVKPTDFETEVLDE